MINNAKPYLSKAIAAMSMLLLPTACEKADSPAGGANTAGSQSAGVSATSGNAGRGVAVGGSGGEANASSVGGTSTACSVVSAAGRGLQVELGAARQYVVLAKSGISAVPPTAITGSVGLSPAAATFITGFSLSADPTNTFSTSPQVGGKLFAADDAPPTPANLTAAVGDMQLAFADAAGRAPDFSEVGAGNVGGMTLAAGVYKWATGLTLSTDLTLSGSANSVWIFQIAQDLTLSSGAKVVLVGGALARNVFWQVSGLVELGTTAHCEGVILTQTSVTLGTGASLNGRLLAQTAISIDSGTIVEPTN